MTIKIAVTGKSGSGKTTITKALLQVLKEKFPEKSFLLFDTVYGGSKKTRSLSCILSLISKKS